MIALSDIGIAMEKAYRGKLPVLPVRLTAGNKGRCLRQYLKMMYDKQFSYCTTIPDIIQEDRAQKMDILDFKRRKFSFDARCEELGLVIHILAPEHYRSIDAMDRDKDKAKWVESLGYVYVQWPFWMAWNTENIKMMLGIDFESETYEPLSEYLFMDNKMNCSLMPWSFTSIGYAEFMDEAAKMGDTSRRSLQEAIDKAKAGIESKCKNIVLDDISVW